MSCSRTQCSDAGEAQTRCPSVSSQALYHWATALPVIKVRVMFWTEATFILLTKQAMKVLREECRWSHKTLALSQEEALYFYHNLLVVTLNSFNAFTVTVTPQSVLWKYTCNLCGPTVAEVQVELDKLEVVAYPSATRWVTGLRCHSEAVNWWSIYTCVKTVGKKFREQQ